MRSWMIVPGLDEETLASGFHSGTDALVIDLCNVLPAMKDAARAAAAAFLQKRRAAADNSARRYVLIHPFASGRAEADLGAIMPAGPDGILLPGVQGGADVQKLDVMISVEEAVLGLPFGQTEIVAVCGDSTQGVLAAASLAGKSDRLTTIAWSMADLVADLGATRFHRKDGQLADSLQLARSLTLLAAAAAGTDVVDAPSGLFYPDRLLRDCREARADGFTGKFALHAAQVPVINALFTPSRAELTAAQAVIDILDRAAPATAFAPDGRLLTAKDRLRALKALARAALSG